MIIGSGLRDSAAKGLTNQGRASQFHGFGCSPEFAFLIACCADNAPFDGQHSIESLNWVRLQHLAEFHKVLRPVSHCLQDSEQVPAETRDWFRNRQEAEVRRALVLSAEMLKIVEALESRGVKTIPYKGPVLAQFLHGDVASRQFGDLDLLVREQDAGGAKAVLIEMGYEPAIQMNGRQEKAYLNSASEYVFHGARGRNLMELHWRIVPRFYAIDFSMEELFSRAASVEVGGQPMQTLCPEDLFLVLCVHAAKHSWNQLSNLCDIAKLATSRELDWRSIERRAEKMGIRRIAATTLLLLRQTNLCELPAHTVEWIARQPASPGVVERILSAMDRGVSEDPESPEYFRLMLGVRERWQDRARMLWRLLWNAGAGEWNSVRLPDRLFSFYRAVRLFRLAGKFSGITS